MALHLDIGMIKETYARFNADKAPRLAAALSYTTIFAIAPVLIIVIAIVGGIIAHTVGHGHGHSAVRDQLLGAIQASAGKGAADAVRADGADGVRQTAPVADRANRRLGHARARCGGAVRRAAGRAQHRVARRAAEEGIWQTVRDRLASIGMLLAIGFLLLVTTALNAAIAYVSTYVSHALPFPGAGIVFALINWIVSVALITLLFALMFKYLPDAKIEWRDVWTGALVTAVRSSSARR